MRLKTKRKMIFNFFLLLIFSNFFFCECGNSFTLIGNFTVENAAFFNWSNHSRTLFISQFTANPLESGSIAYVDQLPPKLNKDIHSIKTKTLKTANSLIWPNEMTNYPKEYLKSGKLGFVLGDGFIPPGKSTGSITSLTFDATIQDLVVKPLTKKKDDWFYHKARFIDVDCDGELDIITARAFSSVFSCLLYTSPSPRD